MVWVISRRSEHRLHPQCIRVWKCRRYGGNLSYKSAGLAIEMVRKFSYTIEVRKRLLRRRTMFCAMTDDLWFHDRLLWHVGLSPLYVNYCTCPICGVPWITIWPRAGSISYRQMRGSLTCVETLKAISREVHQKILEQDQIKSDFVHCTAHVLRFNN